MKTFLDWVSEQVAPTVSGPMGGQAMPPGEKYKTMVVRVLAPMIAKAQQALQPLAVQKQQVQAQAQSTRNPQAMEALRKISNAFDIKLSVLKTLTTVDQAVKQTPVSNDIGQMHSTYLNLLKAKAQENGSTQGLSDLFNYLQKPPMDLMQQSAAFRQQQQAQAMAMKRQRMGLGT